jgi:hypothetical protein
MIEGRTRMAQSRRIRETRAIYTRVPEGGSFRVNSPDGFLHDFQALPVPSDASDIDGIGGAWWFNDGDEPWSRTVGSKLTERANAARGDQARSSVLPAITRCTTILVESVVRTRWLYRDGAGAVMARPLWVDDPMLLGKAPGPIFPLQPAGKRLDAHSFWASLLADAILFGRGAFVYVESSDGSPLPGSLIPLNPLMIDVDEAGHVILDRFGKYPLRTDWDGRFLLGGDTWRVAVLPGQYPNHAGWPQGVLLRHFATFRLGASIGRYLEGLYSSGVPSGYLSVSTPNFGMTPVLDPDDPSGRTKMREADLLKRDWMRAHGRGRRSVAVLNSTVAYTPIAISPVDSDVAKLASASRTDIAHAFGMSSVWLDEGMSGLNYSNSSERRADLVSMTAAGWGEKLTRLVSSLMPYGTEAGVNWSTFVAPSMETMLPALVQAVTAGIYTAGEARQLLGFTPWEGPDPAFHDNSPAASTTPQEVTP